MSLARRRLKPWVPWVIKYRPRRIDEVVDQEEAKKILIPWFRKWMEGEKPLKRAALLYGPPGVGKTSLIEAIANEFNFELLELNASDYRSAEAIRRTVGVAAKKKPLWGNGIIILLDEIDGIAPREDAGGLRELLRIIPETENPIVMTANDPWKEQLRPLHELCEMVRFKPLSTTQIVKVLERICRLEGLECEREALRYIAEVNQGDVRAAINDLQAVAEGYGRVTLQLVKMIVRGREKKIDVFRTLNQVFYADKAWKAKKAVTQSEEDYETLLVWIADNVPRKYTDAGDAFRAFDALARATVFLNRAKYGGHWSLLSYVFDLMGPGVALARKGEISKARYSYPDRIKMMARLKEVRQTREALAEKLASRILASKRTVKSEVLPILFIIFREAEDPTMAARLALGYRLERGEVEFLAGPRAGEILRLIERIKKARGIEEAAPSRVEAQATKSEAGARRERRTRRRKKGERGGRTLDSFF